MTFHVLVLCGALLLASVRLTYAQTSNLLANASFEAGGFVQATAAPDGSAFYNVPEGWGGGVLLDGAVFWQNIMPNGYPHSGSVKTNGVQSYHVSRGYATFTAWIYQRVATVPNTPLEGGAAAFVENPSGTAFVRAGIDPTGGTNPFAPTVIWGASAGAPNAWNAVRVSARATGGVATFFLFASQGAPADPNGVYWDDAFLFGQGGASLVPAHEASAPSSERVVVPNVQVNVRTGASVASPRIGVANPNTAWRWLATEGDWHVIDFNGQRGYVSAAFTTLRDGTTDVPAAVSSETGVTYTANANQRVRRAPTTQSARIGAIQRGETVAVLAKSADGQWVQVRLANGRTGWASARFGTLNGSVDGLPVGG